MSTSQTNEQLGDEREADYRANTALVLPGGGARAAYQVGVLKALAEIHGKRHGNPFPILAGTSAGGINAASLAAGAHHYTGTIKQLELLWRELSTDKIYRADFFGVLRNAIRLAYSLFNSGGTIVKPVALLDNSPLRKLLGEYVKFENISRNILNRDLDAFCLTAMNYTEGVSETFFQGGPQYAGWQRWRRQGVATPIQLQHLMASTAIPTIFPPAKVGRFYYGDGALRQLTPISPVIHLGANRVLVIPANGHKRQYPKLPKRIQSPGFGQIIGHLLNSAFIDSIETDIERLERINELIRLIPEENLSMMGKELLPIDCLVISPSEDIDRIADEHVNELPRSLRMFLRGSGSNGGGGVSISSYLLFTPEYCGKLIDLGYRDGMAQKSELIEFLYRPQPSKPQAG
ncbi:MAG: patatin-like phospholipase family protein [Zhongshania sp.]|uniref:patatin-like phospholipase family protein n=1 Tax=Zhongshania sp. TaxID=1971902 RepID=UPI0026280003|nr:patatin-like phospholipase family protein [Zhongshania sp.]MDF1691726.1 patatin-like phospholipase family protein [Zhongshania sp.]